MKDVRIKDLYAGKPDAKDEINFEGWENFIKTFVVAAHFNLDQLTDGNHCFITGFKGTGKTALLFYLDEKLRRTDNSTCSSFIFFKEDYTDTKKTILQEFSKRIMSSIFVEQGSFIEATEFEYVWRWIFFKQIVNDNEAYSGNLFVDDKKWQEFERIVNQIKGPSDKRKITLVDKVKIAVDYKRTNSISEVSPEIEVDFRHQTTQQYHDFVNLVDEAESVFSTLTRTDIPYYIFVDELEAYYGDKQVFFRDLYMIRDLIFTVKRINTIISTANMSKTKIICSVRSEIITAIQRFIVTKEINKVTTGFSVPLQWNYTNNNSYAHPIIQILIKRITICLDNDDYKSDLQIYRAWFPEKIHDIEAASYILNNSWCKPRDIVRLIMVAQNSLRNDLNCFSQVVFDSISKSYSEESLQEIKEELRALYSSEEINDIITCFTGYRTTFSSNDLKKRIDNYFSGTILQSKYSQVIDDLYRLGFLGNFLPASKTYRWHHKGDSSVILSDEWRLCVHYALQNTLSIGKRHDKGIEQEAQIGDVAKATVYRVHPYYAFVYFYLKGQNYRGSIHISEFGRRSRSYILELTETVVKCNDQFNVSLISYDIGHNSWKLKLLSDE